MEFFTVKTLDGETIEGVDENWVMQNYPNNGAQMIEAAKAVKAKKLSLNAVRLEIEQRAGDQPKILANVADVASIGLIGMIAIVNALSAADNFDDLKAGINAALDSAMGEGAALELRAFLTDAKSQEIKIPAFLKGVRVVLGDAAECSNAVSSVLVEAAQAQGG